MLLLSSARSKH